MNVLPVLKELLNNIETQNISSYRELINQSSQLAVKFLNYKYQPDRAKFNNIGYSFADIAVEAIAPLFIKNKTSEIGIIKSFKDWQKPIDTEEAAQYFLNKIVVNRVEQELIKIYKEEDPFFAKIHDSISFVMEKEGYIKQTHFGTVYLHLSVCESAKGLITHEEFETLPASLFLGKLKKAIMCIFNYLADETDYQQAIPMNLLIKRLKRIYLSDSYLVNNYILENNDESIDVQTKISESLNRTINKLNKSYNRKLSECEITAFEKALKQISIDLADGGISSELYYYLKNQIPGISKELFYEKYHSILDYLLRTYKKEIVARLEKY